MAEFSLTPCVKCQAPFGWQMTADLSKTPPGTIIQCLCCGNEVKGDTDIQAVRTWCNDFFVVARQAFEQVQKLEKEQRLRQGLPLQGGPKIVPGRG